MDSPVEQRPPVRGGGAGISVRAESSSQHPGDWGRALASAVSRLVEQIIDTTGIDPCHEPGGLDLSLHITGLPGGEAITVTWMPASKGTEELSPNPPLVP
ncbi:hypothetical protein [Arthrobacter sp. H35-D1]|uniref:hypothetical protein n=1 Tax=Arthrobacter sp. H35-D1 TaxID=3046202 RepID=UPI0024B95ABF|nr:hypothetical protein [Arthrobacter sp. H35-D1]MDJ0313875.1 hypothetical protein [Arthrobacter sp. H35-D1]